MRSAKISLSHVLPFNAPNIILENYYFSNSKLNISSTGRNSDPHTHTHIHTVHQNTKYISLPKTGLKKEHHKKKKKT
jgi:hypothetical protein